MWITDKSFWLDTLERCIGTMAEVAIPLIPVSGTTSMDLRNAIFVIVGSGTVCFLKCIVKAQMAENKAENKSAE